MNFRRLYMALVQRWHSLRIGVLLESSSFSSYLSAMPDPLCVNHTPLYHTTIPKFVR